jgi:ATP-dependent exoDNAse (exonuclease V) beta subunit
LAERLFTIFQLQTLTDESGYVCAFFDQLSQFCQDNTTDIDSFIREWDETIGAKTIQSTETDGIRILTIHKSKGLEFDNVIIPYADWRLEMPDVLWCQPHEDPFSALPLVPVDYSEKQMRGTVYEHDYLDEHLQNTVDNLNLLYVAFTRASHHLFVIGRRAAKNTRALLIETVLPALRLDGARLDGADDEEAILSFQYGTLVPQTSNILPTPSPSRTGGELHQTSAIEHHTSENVFLQPVRPIQVGIETFTSPTEFRQSNRSRNFVEGDDETHELSYIKMGSVLHEVFSRIRTTADISQALNQLQSEGIIYDDELSRERITSLLRKRLESERIASWFSPRWQLFNECSILRLDDDGHLVERRPDRVMTDGSETHVVDFKFGKPHPEYIAQVQEYMQLLSEMGMPKVHGWLWYVYTNKIEEVRL